MRGASARGGRGGGPAPAAQPGLRRAGAPRAVRVGDCPRALRRLCLRSRLTERFLRQSTTPPQKSGPPQVRKAHGSAPPNCDTGPWPGPRLPWSLGSAGVLGAAWWSLTPSSFTIDVRSEEHTSELQSLTNLVCRLLL